MTGRAAHNEETTLFALPAILTCETAGECAAAMRTVKWPAKRTVAIDASAVELITTSGLQLVLSLAATIKKKSGALTIDRPSPFFLETAALLGLPSPAGEWAMTQPDAASIPEYSAVP